MSESDLLPNTDVWLDEVAWNADGLVPAIAQDADSELVLMVAWMNREALKQTVAQQQRYTGRVPGNECGTRVRAQATLS